MRVALALLLVACSPRVRATIPPPAAPLAATAADAIPDPPPPEPAPPFELGPVHVRVLGNGLTAIVAPRPWAGASVVVACRSAASRDRRAFRGLTQIMGELMFEATRTERGIERDILGGFTPHVTAADGGLLIRQNTTRDDLNVYFLRLGPALRSPHFEPGDLIRLIGRESARIRSTRHTIDGIVERFMITSLYARSDRRSQREDGGLPALERVRPELVDLRFRQSVVASQSALIVVGDVDPEAVFAMAESSLGVWRTTGEPASIDPPRYREEGTRVLAMSSLARAYFFVRERAPHLGHPDHPAFLVITKLLGGMFTSRLNLELREQEGASYGLNASYRADITEGVVDITTSVENGRAVDTLHRVVRELGRMGTAIEDGELERARAQAREGLISSLEDRERLADALAYTFLADLPPESLEARVRAIDSLSREEIQAAAARWLRPDRAAIAVLADFQTVEGRLRYSGVGPMRILRAPMGRSR